MILSHGQWLLWRDTDMVTLASNPPQQEQARAGCQPLGERESLAGARECASHHVRVRSCYHVPGLPGVIMELFHPYLSSLPFPSLPHPLTEWAHRTDSECCCVVL